MRQPSLPIGTLNATAFRTIFEARPLGSISFDTTENWHGRNIFRGVRFGNFQQTAQVPKNQIIHLGVVNMSCDASSHFFCFESKWRVVFKNLSSRSLRIPIMGSESENPKVNVVFLGVLMNMNTLPQTMPPQKHGVYSEACACEFFSYWKGGCYRSP